MNLSNHTSGPAYHSISFREHRPRIFKRSICRGGTFWPRFFSVLLLSTMLLSPAGTMGAKAAGPGPIQLTPADGLITTSLNASPLGIPEFSWQPIAGATKYRLQFSTTIGFSTHTDFTTSNISFTPESLSDFPDGLWYWRVRVDAPTASISDYSSTWTFRKQWASAGNLPQLTSPGDSATFGFYDVPIFSWTPVTGAAKYTLQIYTSPGGWSTLIFHVDTLSTTYQPIDKLTNGTYYWRVVPVDTAGRQGTPSAERRFTENYNPGLTLLEPDPNVKTFPTFTPTFRWTAVRGAEIYRLQYATNSAFTANLVTINTKNTSYTPVDTLLNDQDYYWRVGVISGASGPIWTAAAQPFRKKWYIRPELLTPRNNYQHVRFPLFSWTPVPEASYYILELDTDINFTSPIYLTSEKTANPFYTPSKYVGGDTIYYWRVTPYDSNARKGSLSDTWSYRSYATSVAPDLVYPLYYYPPDTYEDFPDVTTNPHEDRTIPLPVFMWHHVLVGPGLPHQGEVYPDSYRIEVSSTETFATVDWFAVTENTIAAPTAANPFAPVGDGIYFWRVCGLMDGYQATDWSQIWKTRIDTRSEFNKALPSFSDAAPRLLRPIDGYEYAEASPLLEWFPKTAATSYDVEISLDSNFAAGTVVDSATVNYPMYVPTQALGMRRLEDENFGIFYWHVRQHGGSTWSDPRRFQVAAQSEWSLSRNLGELVMPSLLATDPVDQDDDHLSYELTDIYQAQTDTYWHYGFHVPYAPTEDVTYTLYLDMDRINGSGATLDPRGYTLTTAPAQYPEYAIYLLREGGLFSVSRVYIYHWSGGSWGAPQTLASLGGTLSQTSGYVEIKGPNSIIGYDYDPDFTDFADPYAITLLSLPAGDAGQPENLSPAIRELPKQPLFLSATLP